MNKLCLTLGAQSPSSPFGLFLIFNVCVCAVCMYIHVCR